MAHARSLSSAADDPSGTSSWRSSGPTSSSSSAPAPMRSWRQVATPWPWRTSEDCELRPGPAPLQHGEGAHRRREADGGSRPPRPRGQAGGRFRPGPDLHRARPSGRPGGTPGRGGRHDGRPARRDEPADRRSGLRQHDRGRRALAPPAEGGMATPPARARGPGRLDVAGPGAAVSGAGRTRSCGPRRRRRHRCSRSFEPRSSTSTDAPPAVGRRRRPSVVAPSPQPGRPSSRGWTVRTRRDSG